MNLLRFKQFSLQEKAVSADEVISNEPGTGLVKYERTRNGLKHVVLTLYDFEKKIVEGYIELERFQQNNVFSVARTYAIDKHGPLMYELALSVIHPMGLVPSRTIRPGATKVWTYFDKNRPDVDKKMLPKDHELYTEEFDVDIEHQHLKDEEALKIINQVYTIKKKLDLTEMISRGDKMMKEKGLTPGEVAKIGYKAFDKKYQSDF